jgi:cytochrome c-type biogenesis protein
MTPEQIGIAIAFTAGLLSFLSPCVLPLIPSYLCFVTGMNLEEVQGGVDRSRVLTHAVLFVAGFSAVFILTGATVSFLGQVFRHYEAWIARIGGVIVLVLGLHLLGVFRIAPLLRERQIELADRPAGYLGTVGVGMAFGAAWIPCTGPILGGIYALAWVQETFWSGIGLLTVYSAGLAVPFLVSAVALDRMMGTVRRYRWIAPVAEKAAGGLLVALGLLLITGGLTVLNEWLLPLTPDFLYERL